MMENGLQAVLRYLPVPVCSAVQQMPAEVQTRIQEVRLRAEKPVAVVIQQQERFLAPDGTRTQQPAKALRMSQRTLEQTFQAVCSYSVYCYAREISQGFITVNGGNRVGIAGSAVYRDGVLTQVHHITGLNFRISHSVTGCAEELYGQTCSSRPQSVLLAGAVGSGKTTMLRDMCRLLGAEHRVSLIDGRSEIAAVQQGVPRYDVGLHTDVLDGYARAEGLLTALRVMTPDVLVCDEIGTEADAEAILRIHGCGVPVVASAHAVSWEDVQHRAALEALLRAGAFQYVALLDGQRQGHIRQLRRLAA